MNEGKVNKKRLVRLNLNQKKFKDILRQGSGFKTTNFKGQSGGYSLENILIFNQCNLDRVISLQKDPSSINCSAGFNVLQYERMLEHG